jgi:exodeoxyribonuclease V gamma subunit
LGREKIAEVGRHVERLLDASAREREHDAETYDVEVELADGSRLTGAVSGVRGDVLLNLTYSKLGARQRLQAWVDLVALTVSHPDRQWQAVTVGRDGKGPKRSVMECPSATEARILLEELVALYRAGLRSPLPLPVKTAERYAFLRHRGSATPAARVGAAQEWDSSRFPGESADVEHVLLYGDDAPLTALTTQRPLPGEAGGGWPADETDRFGLLARRLWDHPLDHENVTQR